MKNLLSQFKEEVGKLLINFGEKLVGEIKKTNERVDLIEKRLEKLEKSESPKQTKKEVKSSNLNPSTKDDLDLLKKFNRDKWALFEGGKAYNKNLKEKLTVEISDFDNKYEDGVYGIAGLPVRANGYNGNKETQFKLNRDIENYIEIPLQYEDILAALNIVNWRHKESWQDLSNIRFELKDNVLNIVASDSYRIVKKSIDRKGEDFAVSIGGLLLENIKTDFKKYGQDVKVFLSGEDVKLTYKNRVFTCESKQKYCDYQYVYDRQFNHEVESPVPNFDIKSIEGYLKTIKANEFVIENNKIKGLGMEIDGDVNGLYGSYNIKFIKDALSLKPKSINYDKNKSSNPISFKGEYDIIVMPCAIRD